MPTKKITKSTKKITKTPVKKAIKGKESKVTVFSTIIPRVSNGWSSLRERVLPESTRSILKNKRVVYPLTVAAGLVILGFLAYKHLVVAWVDYYPVTRLEFYKELEDKYGAEIKDNLITERLILNEARKRNVTVSNDEIKQELSKLEQQQGGAEQLDQILTMQNISRSELERRFKFRILVNKMFGMNAVVSEEEINTYIEQNKDQILALGGQQPQTDEQGNILGDAQSASVSAQVRQEIKDQLMQQKVSDEFTKWLEESKNSSRVKRV